MTTAGEDALGRPEAVLRLTDEQRLQWLRLTRSENVGPRLFQTLINRYGGAKAALEALPDLARKGGLPRPITIFSRAEAEKELEAATRLGAEIIGYGESAYPLPLRMSQNPPPMLTIRGDRALMQRVMVAIVGSRNASMAGLKMATRLAHDLGAQGYAIVSGLARGIDMAAHEAASTTGTVMVLAGGQDRIYPADHAGRLEQFLALGGLAVTEMPMGWEPRAQDFPRRNRIIAGLSAGLIVVEAAERSGSLITARLALEDNREIFAVPGSPLDPRAFGPNRLIKEGACLVSHAQDVHEVLSGQGQTPFRLAEPQDGAQALPAEEPNPDERARILTLLGATPVALDELGQMAQVKAGIVRAILLELELAGRLHVEAGGAVSLVP